MEVGGLGDLALGVAHRIHDLLGHPKRARGDEEEMHLVVGEERRQRVHGAAVLQVAGQSDRQPVDGSFFLFDGVQVEQRLGGMLAGAVARVQNRTMSCGGRLLRGADLRVTQHDDVGVALDGLDRVVQGFALRYRRQLGLGHADHLAAQAQHRGLERQPRAGARLVEEGGEDLAAEHVERSTLIERCLVLSGRAQNEIDLLDGELVGAQDILTAESLHEIPPWRRQPGRNEAPGKAASPPE